MALTNIEDIGSHFLLNEPVEHQETIITEDYDAEEHLAFDDPSSIVKAEFINTIKISKDDDILQQSIDEASIKERTTPSKEEINPQISEPSQPPTVPIQKTRQIAPKKKIIIKTCALPKILKDNVDFSSMNDIELEEEKEIRIFINKNKKRKFIVCPKCKLKCSNQFTFEQHYALHLVKKPYRCPICKITTKTPYYLLRHFFQHSNFPFICRRCSTAFKTTADVAKHLSKHSSGKERCDLSFRGTSLTSTFKQLLHQFLIRQSNLNSSKVSSTKEISNTQSPILLILKPPRKPIPRLPSDQSKTKRKVSNRQDTSNRQSQKVLKMDSHFCFSNVEVELEEEKELRLYLESIADNSVVQCPKCPTKFATKSLLEQHYACHLLKPPYICPLCQKYLKDTTALMQHFRHHGNFPFICQKCNTAFKFKDDLESHSRHHTEGFDPSVVPHCCASNTINYKNLVHEFLIRQSSINLHQAYKIKEEVSSPEKGSSFDSDTLPIKEDNDSLQNFINPFAVNSDEFIELDEEKELRLYLDKFSDSDIIECLKCQVKFVNKSLLEHHYITHMVKAPLVCPVCDRDFKIFASFISHLKNHSKTLGCHKCLYIFRVKRDLDLHRLTHVNESEESSSNMQKNEAMFFKRIVHEFMYNQTKSQKS